MPRWIRIRKEDSVQPTKGDYSSWKPILRTEADGHCVYCGTHESGFGGVYFAHVEHFRPKSSFGKLEKEIGNLFYACAICNVFKSNDWPRDPTASEPSYLDPSQIDYSTVFVASDGHLLTGTNTASRYMVERINLNRPQLLAQRREERVLDEYQSLQHELEQLLTTDLAEPTVLRLLLQASNEVAGLLISLRQSSPHEPSDTKRG